MSDDRHRPSGRGAGGSGTPFKHNKDRAVILGGGRLGNNASQPENEPLTRPYDPASNTIAPVSDPTQSSSAPPTDDAFSPRNDVVAKATEIDNGSRAAIQTSQGVRKDRRKSSAAPNLTLDTVKANRDPQHKSPQAHMPPLSPTSARSPVSISSGMSPLRSPISPRTRDRGFSLRRSILARSIHGQPESSGSVVELQPIGASTVRDGISQAPGGGGSGKKHDTTVSVSPIIEHAPVLETESHPVKKTYLHSSLPHYESWVASKAGRKGFLARAGSLKETLRKRILRIQEISPSKDGRHLELDPTRKKPLIDERTGREYIDNTILSSRYTLYNFFPRQLFAQFSKLANFYFLCVSILQLIPGLSTTGTYTTIVPLLFFVTISMAKEGYDDLRRYRLDKAENNRTASVLRAYNDTAVKIEEGSGSAIGENEPKPWVETKWHNIRVGDIVRLKRDDAAPADLALLHTHGTAETAYVETMALDGETNLKSKQPSPPLTKSCRTIDEIARCRAHLVVEDPNLDLYNFEGKVTVGEETLPLTNNEIMYRGSVLRNTSEAIGLVVYSGEECKIRMNATKNPRIKAVCNLPS